ncbi:hypothetical protein ACJIZ3_001849 [Penstemon smallii]|uniref:Integral membrane bound transporter domain-containing protein n=1 Tax=Penstemon smallii TaxID=265156 RepID=A0ABD3U4T3_9LAMI
MVSLRIQSDRTKAVWRRSLASAFRTALACIIVGGVTLYGPEFIKQQVAFPAFSYVTVILIVTDATLGHTFRCCWFAIFATVLGVCPAILSLSVIGPDRLTTSTTSAVVAVSAFVVALPENTHLISKRIALGQIVIVYVIAFINGDGIEPVMHPVHVAASTAVGVGACVLALLFPYPSLAFFEVKENCKKYIENASERLNLFVNAFSAEENSVSMTLISKAKSLNVMGRKLLHGIKSNQESMHWEILPVKLLKSHITSPGQKLENLETVLKGMEIALTNHSRLSINSDLKNDLVIKKEQFLNQIRNLAFEKTVLPQSDTENLDSKFLQTLQTNTIPLTGKYLNSWFFIFCMKLLQTKSETSSPTKQGSSNISQNKWWSTADIINSPFKINKKRLMPALKCSLSLGLAVFFGLIYSKENGYWSGLPVAISLAAAREATFKVANIKAQGTVLGTVYGVIGCFIFEQYVKIRFISLLPWFIFCSFLRQSRMYGQAGGISAVIGALLILGRTKFGTPSDFAIARIVETFIGLSCSIMVDILLQPTRASVLAKFQLSMSLRALHETVRLINLENFDKSSVEEMQKKLKFNVNEFKKYIEEAEVEPNFWFLPFHSASYSKLLGSLSKMVDLLLFGCNALKFLEQESRNIESRIWKEACEKLESDIKVLKDVVCSGVKCFEEVSLVKPLVVLEREFEKRKNSVDLEMGKSKIPDLIQWSGSNDDDDDDEMEKNTNSFLLHVEELVGGDNIDEEEHKIQMVMSLSALVFCMNCLVKETKEIEKAIKEVVQWENPSSQVDLHDISCKIHALGQNVKI